MVEDFDAVVKGGSSESISALVSKKLPTMQLMALWGEGVRFNPDFIRTTVSFSCLFLFLFTLHAIVPFPVLSYLCVSFLPQLTPLFVPPLYFAISICSYYKTVCREFDLTNRCRNIYKKTRSVLVPGWAQSQRGKVQLG